MAYTFDNKGIIAETISSPVITSYTCGATATLLVVGITMDGGQRVGGAPTYNSVVMTQAGTPQHSGSEGWSELWYLLAPSVSSSFTLSIPNINIGPMHVVISSYISGTGISEFDTSNQASDSSITATVNVTPTTTDSVIVDSMFNGSTAIPPDNNRTLLFKTDTGGESNAHQYYITSSTSSTTMEYTLAGTDDWAIVAGVFKEGAEGAGTNMQINIGDAWKEVPAIKINIGDDWKDVVAIKQNIGDSWKDVF